jgi:hypothetical protein
MRPGVYLLLGPEPDGSGDLAYIGEADDTVWLSQAQMADSFTRATLPDPQPGQRPGNPSPAGSAAADPW